MGLLDRLRRKNSTALIAPGGELADRFAVVEHLLGRAVVVDRRENFWRSGPSFATTGAGRALADADDATVRAAALWAHQHLVFDPVTFAVRRRPFVDITSALARRHLDWTGSEALYALHCAVQTDDERGFRLPEHLKVPLAALEQSWPRLTAEERAETSPILAHLAARVETASDLNADARRSLTRKIQALLYNADQQPERAFAAMFSSTDQYAACLDADLRGRLSTRAGLALLTHCTTLTKVPPSNKWASTASTLAAELPDAPALLRQLLTPLPGLPETTEQRNYGGEAFTSPAWLGEQSAITLRGVLVTAALLEPTEPALSTVLADVAICAGVGFGGSGGLSRSQPLASTAIAFLARRSGVDAVAALSRVQAKVANKTLRKAIGKALDEIADRAGMSAEQLLERAVPSFGLEEVGRATAIVGEHTATITVTPLTATLAFADAAGRNLKSTPAAVKARYAAELADLKAQVTEIRKSLGTQRLRVENLLAAGNVWTVDDWVQLYRDHPLTGVFARSLLWQTTTDDSADDEASWVTGWPSDDGSLICLDGSTRRLTDAQAVRLWHPALVPAEEVRAWRERLVVQEVRQPFKQAFREVYLLTPAEVTTSTYSNRFAAHIVRYPQFGALLRARGWNGTHLGYWDGGYDGSASKDFGDWRAQFFYELAETEETDYDATPPYAATDQVRFHRRGPEGWEIRPLDEVPSLVFSEAMRDVDLFVGVTSIAGDPNWTDRGEQRYADYWQRVAFGELTETAQTRRAALERLMPRTKIADRASVGERFLIVRGDLRTYKIHLGSGNILMEPNDAYLCIVPGRKADDSKQQKVFLPFEEDGGLLSVIVSKAFLLANDKLITDPTITRQLKL